MSTKLILKFPNSTDLYRPHWSRLCIQNVSQHNVSHSKQPTLSSSEWNDLINKSINTLIMIQLIFSLMATGWNDKKVFQFHFHLVSGHSCKVALRGGQGFCALDNHPVIFDCVAVLTAGTHQPITPITTSWEVTPHLPLLELLVKEKEKRNWERRF